METRKFKETDYLVTGKGKIIHKGKEVGYKAKSGRYIIRFGRKGESIMRNVMVAQTYPDICGEWFDGCQVHHINGNKEDDRPSNLKVVSHFEHLLLHNAIKITARVNNGVIDRVYNSASEAEIENHMLHNHGHIWRAIKGLQETCKGYKWIELDYSDFNGIFVTEKTSEEYESCKELIYKKLLRCLDGGESPPISTNTTNIDLASVFKGFHFN